MLHDNVYTMMHQTFKMIAFDIIVQPLQEKNRVSVLKVPHNVLYCRCYLDAHIMQGGEVVKVVLKSLYCSHLFN